MGGCPPKTRFTVIRVMSRELLGVRLRQGSLHLVNTAAAARIDTERLVQRDIQLSLPGYPAALTAPTRPNRPRVKAARDVTGSQPSTRLRGATTSGIISQAHNPGRHCRNVAETETALFF